MELQTINVPGWTQLEGQAKIQVNAGQSLKIETSPDGEDIVDVEVPAGKSWAITIQVAAVETDA